MTKSVNFWHRLLSTLWFVPALLGGCGILLGLFFIGVDYFIGDRLGYFPRFFGIQPSGAREILAVIANSSLTVAVTAFSITIVALALASTQFSPRILRNFMRDAGNQIVLGILVGIFAYCIVVLRTIREGGGNPSADFVPTVAAFAGVIFGFVGIGCLIYFIHHVATSIQATSIIAAVAGETIGEIRNTFPRKDEAPPLDEKIESKINKAVWTTINSTESGYIQNADTRQLTEIAEKYDLIVRMKRRVGQFSLKDLPLLEVAAGEPNFRLDEHLKNLLLECYDIGSFRTVEGDVAFGVRQISDIALKALSPAINDTTTAISCIDYLTAILVCLAKRPSCPSNIFVGERLRLIVEQQRFEDFFDLAFNQIRQNAAGNVAVILRQINSINVLSKINIFLDCEAERRERHELMKTQAKLLFELAERTIVAREDLRTIEKYYAKVENLLAEREDKI